MTTSGRSVDWVVFDLGETLVDETTNWRRWAEHLGVPKLTLFGLMGAAIAERRHHTAYFERIRPGFQLVDEVPHKAAAGLPWGFTADDLYPDALHCLAELRRRGYKLAVMANQPIEAAAFLATLPVELVATSAEWGVAKPDPAFFDRLTTEIGAAPHRIAYVGDRVDNDVVPARAAGMCAVHLRRGPWGLVQQSWPEAAMADVQLDDLAALPHSLTELA